MIAPMHLISAFLLDLVMGDPRWMPHPVRIIGKGISGMETLLRKRVSEQQERAAGIVLVGVIVGFVYALSAVIRDALTGLSGGGMKLVGAVVLVYLMSTTLALHDLVASAGRVIVALREDALEKARTHLSLIVGRDTGNLTQEGVLRATVETLAENLSDGFIAPLLYLAIGGLPLAMAYKAVNTLDSMLGYKNEQYIRFGWAAARLDDIANYVPARIAGACVVIAVFLYRIPTDMKKVFADSAEAFRIMLRDGGNHSSPNSGVPEAAMAGALGVRLGGPSTYGGVLADKPYIGDGGTTISLVSAEQAIRLVIIASFISTAAAVLILWISAGGY